MAIITNSAHPTSVQYPQTPISEDEVRERLTTKAIEIVRAIVTNNTHRMKEFKREIQLLGSGIFYGNEYFEALKSANQKARLEFYLQKGSFYHGLAPSKHFDMLKNSNSPTGILANCFVLKEGVAPSAALDDIRQGLSFIGCGETCQIAYYEAVKDVLGTEKFDILFAANSSTPLTIQFNSGNNPINRLLERTSSPKKFVKGRIYQFENTPYYASKHMNGEALGYTTLCCDDTPGKETFTTLGLSPEGMTQAEVGQKMFEDCNRNPIGLEIVTEEVAKRILSTYTQKEISQFKKLETYQFSAEDFAEQGGGRIIASCELNAQRITQLANLSVKEARKLFDQW